MADQTEDRIQKLDKFLAAFPKGNRLTCVYAQPMRLAVGREALSMDFANMRASSMELLLTVSMVTIQPVEMP